MVTGTPKTSCTGAIGSLHSTAAEQINGLGSI